MLLNGSKWNLSSVYLRNKKKIISFLLNGPPPHFWPASQSLPNVHPAPRLCLGPAQLARLACLRAGPLTRPALAPCRAVPAHHARPRQGALAAWPPCTGDARRAAAPACLALHALAFICCPRCAPHFTLPLAQKPRQQQRAPALATERRRCPAGDVPLLPRLLSSIPAANSSTLGPCLACTRWRLPSSR